MQSTAFMPHHLPFIDFVLQPNIINNNNNNNRSQYCSSSITTTNVHYDPNNMMILSSNAATPNSDHHHLPAAAAPAVFFQPHFHVDHNDHHMNNPSSSAAGLMFMDVVTTKNEGEYPININVGHSIKSVDKKAATVMADKRKRRSAGYHISYKERKELGETKKAAKGLIYGGRHDQAEGQADDHEDPPKEYIHVRARRGQATDSHSLAERVRREKISERMRMLQELVPGCDKVTGKALMLDEIINYVQSLQNQVEFLSMKLASVNPVVYNFNMDLEDYMNFKPDHHQGQMPAQFPAAVLQDASLLFTNELQSDDQSTIVGLLSTQDAMTNTSYNKSTANSSHSTTLLPPTLLSMESGCNDWTAGDINQKQKFLHDQAHVLKRMGYF